MGKRLIIIALILLYVTVVFGGASLKADYSLTAQYISELNATGSEWSWQIGYLGFLPLGLLGLFMLVTVARNTQLTGISLMGTWLLAGEPIAYLGSAFAPCDLGCPSSGSLSQNVHNVLSLITLLMTTLGLVFLSFNKNLTPPGRAGWALSGAVFITLYMLALAPDLDSWRGLLQRLAEGILYGSLCLVSWRLLAATGQAQHHELGGATADGECHGSPP